jgi:hypothetical protein
VKRLSTAGLLVGGVVYAVFAASCFHLAAIHDYELRVSLGEGLFTCGGGGRR